MTVFALLLLAWPVYIRHLVHERDVYCNEHFGMGGGLMSGPVGNKLHSLPQKPLPFGWAWFGARPIHELHLSSYENGDVPKIQRLFPDAYLTTGDAILPDP